MLVVPLWVWSATLVGLILIILADLWIVDRGKSREFTMGQAGFWVAVYVTLAGLFGLGIGIFSGWHHAGQFFAGYLTEYSLSVDNLFVFYLIMARFAVPRGYQHRVLLVGVVMALVLRGVFIVVGAAALHRFEWLFFLFGAFLLYTAVGVFRDRDGEREVEEYAENLALRVVKRFVPVSGEYHGSRLTVRSVGRRMVTPMLLVVIALGTTDLLFALDSIPAIFGLTTEPFLVFTANVFALMGLRQLYFLLGGLLERLVYLSVGLSLILGFIGVKLIFEALHAVGVDWAPLVPIWLSLTIIVVTMVVTTLASVWRNRRETRRRAAPDHHPAKTH